MKRLIISELMNTPEMEQLCDNICEELQQISMNNYGDGIDDMSSEIVKNDFGDMTFKVKGIFYYKDDKNKVYDVIKKLEDYLLSKTIFNDCTYVDYYYDNTREYKEIGFILKATKYEEVIR